MKTINFIISGTINLYIIYLAYVGIISERELNSLVGIDNSSGCLNLFHQNYESISNRICKMF